MTRPTLSLCLLLAASLPGCGDNEPIRTETVPKPAADAAEPKVRLLAAMIEDGGKMWFFKLVGPLDDVAKHTQAFSAFVSSVRLGGKDKPIAWDVPAGWTEGPKKELRYATFFLGDKGKLPELTVFEFDRVSGVLENVNRWCERDLGRRPLRESELKKISQKVKAGDKEATLIDLTGPGAKAVPPMHAGMMPKKAPRPLPIEYKTPEGWTETGPRGGFVPVYTAFAIDDGPPKTEATVLVLRGETGDLLANVNRWRGQVGAAPLDKLDEPPTIEVGGVKGQYFDLEGKQRMLMVKAKRGTATWYLKLLGKPDVVGKNKAAFEEFVKSVKFTGGADE